jgi:hypothetical protein
VIKIRKQIIISFIFSSKIKGEPRPNYHTLKEVGLAPKKLTGSHSFFFPNKKPPLGDDLYHPGRYTKILCRTGNLLPIFTTGGLGYCIKNAVSKISVFDNSISGKELA